jgi:hypothetical protein
VVFVAAFFGQVDKVKEQINSIESDIKLVGDKHGQVLAAISEKQGQSMLDWPVVYVNVWGMLMPVPALVQRATRSSTS